MGPLFFCRVRKCDRLFITSLKRRVTLPRFYIVLQSGAIGVLERFLRSAVYGASSVQGVLVAALCPTHRPLSGSILLFLL